MNLVIVLCEGAHDVAFLSRLLKISRLESYSREIQELPPPLNKLITRKLNGYDYGNLNLDTMRPPLPSIILNRDETYVLLYALGGKNNRDKAEEIINDYNEWFPESSDPRERDDAKKHTVSFAIIFDADGVTKTNETGIEKTVKYIRKFFSEIFKDIDSEIFKDIDEKKIEHANIEKLRENISIGCFVFTHDGENGRLEDIIIPLMEKGNEEIFGEARSFFGNCCDKKGIDEQKAVIGISGQLQKPGCSNFVIIRDSDYITGDKIKNDERCREICDFLDRLLHSSV